MRSLRSLKRLKNDGMGIGLGVNGRMEPGASDGGGLQRDSMALCRRPL